MRMIQACTAVQPCTGSQRPAKKCRRAHRDCGSAIVLVHVLTWQGREAVAVQRRGLPRLVFEPREGEDMKRMGLGRGKRACNMPRLVDRFIQGVSLDLALSRTCERRLPVSRMRYCADGASPGTRNSQKSSPSSSKAKWAAAGVRLGDTAGPASSPLPHGAADAATVGAVVEAKVPFMASSALATGAACEEKRQGRRRLNKETDWAARIRLRACQQRRRSTLDNACW